MKWLRIFGGDHAPQPADKRGGNLFLVKIMLLDDTEIVHEISTDMKGGEVLDQVFKRLNLLETPYFGLRYLDRTGQTHWLDATKKVSKRIKGSPGPCTLYFGVKFYAADPCKLVEEITRYHFFLQVKKDILQGRLPVTFDLAAELGSYAVQSELGDYDPKRHQAGYVSELRLFPSQTAELEEKIAELHRGLLGQVPAVAEMKFLEKVKWLDLYGVDLHPVMGEGNIEYFLGLTPSGVLVLKNKSKVGYYFWPRISKVYFQRRYFMLRVKDGASQERTFGFELPTRQACKHLWRCCVEHHAFFRLTGGGPATGLGNKPPATPKLTTKAFSFVSKFRYSGRTQKEAMEDAKRNARTPPPDFPRRVSKRQNYLKQRRIASGNPSFSDSELACDNKENLRSLNGSTGSSSTLPRIFLSVPKPKANSVILPDSPQSSRPGTRWNSQRGLFSNQSPRSIRSAEVSRRRLHKSEQTLGRSSSVDSITSNDSSRRCRKRHHHHSSRHNSDNESEKSTRSGVSNRHHHFYQNRASRNVMSGKESESDFSDPQAIQRRANQNVDASKHKTEDEVWRSAESGHDVEQRIRRTHRSRSRSPGAAASRARNQLLPEQVRQHMAFNLVDPSEHGMSVDQLRDIPYTKVETNGRPLKIHYSPQAKKVYVKKGVGTPGFPSLGVPERLQKDQTPSDSPPPPYSMPAVVAAGQSPTLADVDHVSSRSSSLRSSSTAQTAILRTPQQFPDVAGHGSLQRRPRMVDSLPGSSATLPRNLNAVRNVQQLQPTPVYWNQVEPFTPPRPAFPVDPRTMGYRTSTPVLNQGQWATPRPMRPMTPVRPNPALPYELPYRQFQPNPGDPVSPNYQNLPPHPYFQYYPRFGEVPHYSPVYTQQTMRKDVGYRGINPGYVASRMPVPQPRNSQYYKSSDYVNQSLCASIGVPAAAAGQVQGASSQELSTEL